MFVFLGVFLGMVLLTALLVAEFAGVNGKAIREGYGPASQVRGSSGASGKLVCVNADAPTLNRSIEFPYAFRVSASRGDISGTYEYRGKRTKIIGPVHAGELFLSFDRDRVKGRSRMAGLKTVDGIADRSRARLRRGYPRSSLLGFLSGPFDYSFERGRVRFERTTRAGNISQKSDLRIQGNRITGRVLHGPQTTWAVDVDVTCNGIASEQAALAVILACDDILCVHHSD